MKVRLDPTGVHFFDRETGLNVLFDEVTVPPSRTHPAPRFVSVALTNACDLHCTFCYAPKHSARLDPESLFRWATELDNNGCLGLGFGGGEPTLHPAFPYICERISTNTHMAVSFTTHGHRLTEPFAHRITKYVHFLRLSMDGVDEIYTRIRGRLFSSFIDKLHLARTIAPFGLNYVVNADTIRHLDAAATLALDCGATELLLIPERPTPRTQGIDETTWQALVDWIRTNRRCRLAISDSAPLSGLPCAHPFHDPDGLTAYAHIDANGRLRTTSYSPLGVTIGSSIALALSRLRDSIGDSQ